MGRRLRLRLAHKVFGSMLIVLCLTAAVGVVSLIQANLVGRKAEQLASHWTPALFQVSELHYLVFQHRSLLEQYVQQDDPEEQSRIEQNMKLTMDALNTRIAEYEKLPIGPSEREGLTRLQGLLKEYQDEVLKSQKAVAEAAGTGRVVPLRSVRLKFLGVDQAIRNMKEVTTSRTTAEAGSVVTSFRTAANTISAITALGLILGLAAAFLLARSLSRPLVALAQAAKRVAHGELDVDPVRVHTKDEIEDLATAFNGMVTSLGTLVRQVAVTVDEMAEAASGLSAQSEAAADRTRDIVGAAEREVEGAELQAVDIQNVIDTVGELDRAIEYVARGASEQAMSLNQIVATVQEMSTALEEINNAAQQVLAASENSETLVERTSSSMNQTTEGMERIRASVVEYGALIREMGRRSSEIGDILKVITEISDQTNLLALNAAIEAARAGEHGRGFAVVADEIRKLAERSRTSAQEIRRVIAWIKQHTEHSIEAMEISVQDVQAGTKLVGDAQQDLDQVQVAAQDTVRRAQTITQLSGQISRRSQEVEDLIHNVAAVAEENTAATEEMAASSHSVNQRMDPIGDVTKQAAEHAKQVHLAATDVAAVTEQTAAAAQSLSTQSALLADLISRFRV